MLEKLTNKFVFSVRLFLDHHDGCFPVPTTKLFIYWARFLLAIIYVLFKHAFLLDARPLGSRWR